MTVSRNRRPPRRGVSLLEVLLSLVIFLMSFVALGQLINLGADRAVDVQHQSLAVQMAQSKLAEVSVGVIPLQSASGTMDEDTDWNWTLEVTEGDVANLWSVTIRVHRTLGIGEVSATLSAMVLDPSIRGNASDKPGVTGQDSTTSSSGTSTTP